MKFAVNYSTNVDKLLRQSAIQTDLIKCPEWQGLVNSAMKLAPVYIHFDIGVGLGAVNQLDFDLIHQLLRSTSTMHLNCHLSNLPNLDKSKAMDRRILLNIWINEINFLKDQFPEYHLVAENLPGEPYSSAYNISCMPELIAEVLLETDIDLLLDLSHASITARNLNQDLDRYIEKFPLNRLREMHITGVKSYRNYLTDHFELNDQDFAIVRWAKSQIQNGTWREPEIVAFEYGGVGEVFGWRCEEKVLREQVPILYDLFSASNSSLLIFPPQFTKFN